MYVITGNAYKTVERIQDGQAPPSHTDNVNVIHSIFQRMQEKQFKVPAEHLANPVIVQAKLKKEAITAFHNDYNSRWGITKFFIFILHGFNRKLAIEKKAEQILSDTGKLYTKANDLGCSKTGDRTEYVATLNQNWLARNKSRELINSLPDEFQELYRNPYTSLEEFLLKLDETKDKTKLLQIRDVISQSEQDSEQPIRVMMDLKTKPISEAEKDLFIQHRQKLDLPELEIGDTSIEEQIAELSDEDLILLIANAEDDSAQDLNLIALNELNNRPDIKVPDDLKPHIAEKLHAMTQVLKDDIPIPFELINKFGLEKEEKIQELHSVAIANKKPNMEARLDELKIPANLEKKLNTYGSQNNPEKIVELIKTLKDEKINYFHALSNLLHKDNKVKASSRLAVYELFRRIENPEERRHAFSKLVKHDQFSQLVSEPLLKNIKDDQNLSVLPAFEKYIDSSKKAVNPKIAIFLFKKLDEEGQIAAFEKLLSKPDNLSSIYLTKDNQDFTLPYAKTFTALLKLKQLRPDQIRLATVCLQRMEQEEQQAAFAEMLNSNSPFSYNQLINNGILNGPLTAFKDNELKKADFKDTLLKNQRMADLLFATDSAKEELYKIYEVPDETALVSKLLKKPETLKLLKILIFRKVVSSDLLEANFDTLDKKIQSAIENDKYLKQFAPQSGK